MREISGCEALREALREEMRRDRNVFVMGEDIGVYGGAFGVTRGLIEEFGAQRVRDTPISEAGIVGAAIGAALLGARPVVEIMFMDFILLALDQLANMAAKAHYVFGGQARCPLVVRTPAGGGRGYGPTHSQSLEALFAHVPGLKVVAPSTPADAKILLKAAIRDNNPVVFTEHKLLYSLRGALPDKEPRRIERLGRARVTRPGRDVTLVAWSWMSEVARRAADDLQEHGIAAELVDLRSLCPLDEETVARSVRKTGRLVVVEEGTRTGGFAAEIGFRMFERAFDRLDGPVRRVTCPDIPLSASATLEQAALPSRQAIVAAARALVAGEF
jgi:acetoin:2,6-dichlorophenolindophenol oxidoreductase subunit beta